VNPISPEIKTGTVGELLVQLRLLQFDVQAAPPLKDSGNDLIAIRGQTLRALQVKTRTADAFDIGDLRRRGKLFHDIVLVQLLGEGSTLWLDESRVFLLSKEEIHRDLYTLDQLKDHE
jgi:hypothetical protein